MSKLDYKPSLVAVFLNPTSRSYLKNSQDWDLVRLFFQRVSSIWEGLPILSNLELGSLQENLSSLTPGLKFIPAETEVDFLQEVGKELPPSQFQDPDWDEVCFPYFSGISPLFDEELTQEAWDRHKKYFSQYSYSENVPPGWIPRFLTREFLASLPEKFEDSHAFFLKNINQFDVDIFFVPPDLRQMRLEFLVNSQRNVFLLRKFLSQKNIWRYSEILPALQSHPEWLRPYPSYIEWEMIQECQKTCTFCPRQAMDLSQDGQKVSAVDGVAFLEALADWIPDSFTICLGGNGEPFLHPEWQILVRKALEIPQLKELIIETALYADVPRLLDFLQGLPDPLRQKFSLIVNLTTLDAERYSRLYGSGKVSEVLGNIQSLQKVLNKKNLHVQMLKILEVKDEIEHYFNYFEKLGIGVVLQKYNRFAGKLLEKRVSDLTPIQRDFCWHLTRDLYVSSDWSVAVCKQDPKNHLGFWTKDSLPVLWEKGLQNHIHSFLGKHQSVQAPCLQCDEWYTFNA